MKLKFTEHQKKYMTKGAQFWVQTLYDSELDQARGALEQSNAFCCLGVGVLCNQLETGENYPTASNGRYLGGGLTNKYSKVKDWLGLLDWYGEPHSCQYESLIDLNDSEEYNFNQIAEVLLQHPEQYFIPVKGK